MLEEVYCLNAHLLRDLKLFTAAIFKDGYFNDGSAEDCYFLEALLPLNTLTTTIFEDCYFTIDNAEDCLFNHDQGAVLQRHNDTDSL